MIERVRAKFLDNPGMDSWHVSGPWFLTEEIDRWTADGGEIHVIPRDLVYPYSWDRLHMGDGPWAPRTVGIHHWSQGRTGRASSRVREGLLDGSRRWELRRRGAWAKAAAADLRGGLDHREDSLWAGMAEGSDTVLDVGSDSPAEAMRAAPFLSEFGRVFVIPGDWDAEQLTGVGPGPGEVIAMGIEDLPGLIDRLSYVSAVHVGPQSDPELVLNALGPAVHEGRIGLVYLADERGEGRVAERAQSQPVASWLAQGLG